MCRSPSSLTGPIFLTQVDQDTEALLRICLDGLCGSQQCRIDIPSSEQLNQSGSRRRDEFRFLEQIDTVPIACEDREKRKRRRARSTEYAEFFTFQVP